MKLIGKTVKLTPLVVTGFVAPYASLPVIVVSVYCQAFWPVSLAIAMFCGLGSYWWIWSMSEIERIKDGFVNGR